MIGDWLAQRGKEWLVIGRKLEIMRTFMCGSGRCLLLKSFPADERFGLVDQIKRSAVSIPSNIAEGAARQTSREFIQFLHIAAGSAAELDTQLIIAQRLGFSTAIESQLEELQIVRKQLNVIIASLREKHEK